jgi:hypothetical protein
MRNNATSPLKTGVKAGIRFCLLLMATWATVAIFYSNLPPTIRPLLAGVFAAASLIALVGRQSTYKTRLGFLAAFSLVLVWWLLMPPSNDRNWQPDLAILPWAEISGDKVTLHNIRNCDYRSETDFTVRHYDRIFDLKKLKGIDFFLVYWGSPSIAHTMLSFVFEGQGNVAISIETRKEKGEDYSTIKGFFRQYELTYVVADERDVVRLRTNYRKEDVYLYHLNVPHDVARGVFLNYLTEINRLKEQPRWYNALTGNCTTSIRRHTLPYNPNTRIDWRLIVNGHIDEMLYENKTIATTLPFAELKQKSYINPAAQAADTDPAFSQRIRENLPHR